MLLGIIKNTKYILCAERNFLNAKSDGTYMN